MWHWLTGRRKPTPTPETWLAAAQVEGSESFRAAVVAERLRTDRNGSPLALLMLALRDETPWTDDACAPLGRWLRERLRQTDRLGHWDATRLGVLLLDTPCAGSVAVAQEIVRQAETLGMPVSVTIKVYPVEPPVESDEPTSDRQEAGATASGSGRSTAVAIEANSFSAHSETPPIGLQTVETPPNGVPSLQSPSMQSLGEPPLRRMPPQVVDARAETGARSEYHHGVSSDHDSDVRSDEWARDDWSIGEPPGEGPPWAETGWDEGAVATLVRPTRSRVASPSREGTSAPCQSWDEIETYGTRLRRTRQRRQDSGQGSGTDQISITSRDLPIRGVAMTADRPTPSADEPPLTLALHPPYAFSKRVLDIAGASAALVVFSPVMVGVAVVVKLTSAGPILFRQERMGEHGRCFTILKFRTMHIDAEKRHKDLLALSEQDGPAFKLTNDPRLTSIGPFLRKTCLDELPQLFNVLRGEMALVGPRPLWKREAVQIAPWQRRRHDVRPGMTCIWQVEGGTKVTFDDWMRMDLRYAGRFSLLRDVALLVRTAWSALRGRASK